MTKLVILGASGHAKSIADAALSSTSWDEIVFYDDAFPKIQKVANWNVLGTISEFISKGANQPEVIIGIGNNQTRVKIHRLLVENNFKIATIIHAQAVVSPFALISEGSVVLAGAVVNAFSKVGKSCIVNTNSNVDHDCKISDFVHICPGANIAGDVAIGREVWVGIGSVIINGVSICDNSVIGAGAVVIESLKIPATYVGCPAKILKDN